MGTSKTVLSQKITMGEWHLVLEILMISGDPNFPDGYRISFVLLKTVNGKKVKHYLVDNKWPHKYHFHPDPKNHSERILLDEQSVNGAITVFIEKVKEVTGEDITRYF